VSRSPTRCAARSARHRRLLDPYPAPWSEKRTWKQSSRRPRRSTGSPGHENSIGEPPASESHSPTPRRAVGATRPWSGAERARDTPATSPTTPLLARQVSSSSTRGVLRA
jgi:hypothetical protein